ncbi:MAG: class I SAM-dependent methyltransferase [Chloroherpetonaceae bacterium]|nr:class I SAM-dependent methyltransferase [Chthonomonadaceae bacterium]MDW8208275.1 class I SAM-dependent methyltransferase [Chloroherpetonaceae bacterium]
MKQASCPVCASPAVHTFLQRKGVPVHQNLIMVDPESARQIARGDLTMAVCTDCGFIFNRTFDPSLLRYGAAYDNTQTCSPSFREYMDGLLREIVEGRGVRNCCVVEVGCGKGQFLIDLVARAGPGSMGVGFDPSYVGPDTALDGRVRFERRFYGADCADVPADAVVCRHVIEHVPEPLEMLGNVRRALRHAPDARVFFETPCVEWILRHQVWWDFFYEHCSLFTAHSLAVAFGRSGFRVERVRHVFGGQYLWLEARPDGQGGHVERDAAGDIPGLAQQFARAEEGLRDEWGRRIEALKVQGKVALWGAGAKGVTFANLVDPDRAHLDCVVDMNPNKQGNYLPGTGHPILPFWRLAERGVRTAILMNPNYRAENERLLREAGLDIALVAQGTS